MKVIVHGEKIVIEAEENEILSLIDTGNGEIAIWEIGRKE